MKVYLNGDVVTVDKTGGLSFDIPPSFAKYTVIGDSIKVSNIINLDQETDLITEIQNQAGTAIGDLNDVITYLSGFIFRADSETAEQASSGEPQDVIVEGLNNIYDAAGALRVANKTVLGTCVQDKGLLVDFIDRVSTGSATQVWSGGVVTMSTSGTDYAVCQTYKRHLYLAGFSQSPELTFNNFNNQTNVVKRLGYYSSSFTAPYTADLDGFFLEADGTNHKLAIYKEGTLIASINRGDWDDPLDGTGPSTLNIDFDLFTIVEFQFLYLGGSGLQMSFNIGGELVKAHLYANSSTNATTFIGSPVQPIRFELRSNGGAATMGQICAGVSTGGALGIVGYPRSIGTPIGQKIDANSVGNQYLIAAIRLKDAKGIGFDFAATTMGTTNDPYIVRFILNPTISSEPAYADLGNSYFEYILGDATSGGASDTTVTGGTVLSTSYISDRVRSGNLDASSLFQPGVDLDGVFDVVALVVEPYSTNLDIVGAINFKTL